MDERTRKSSGTTRQMSKLHERQSVWHEKHWQKWLGLNGGKIGRAHV